jgi:ribosomal protein S21
MGYNFQVKLKPGESQERLIKSFLKRCKKEDIIKEHVEKTSFFMTKSQKKRQKRLKNKFLREKYQ